MHRRGAPTPGSDRGRFVLLLLVCAALGCATGERIASFQLREQVPFGVLTVSVDGWEGVGGLHAPLSSLRSPEGEKTIAVFIGWSGLEPYAESDRQAFVERFLRGRLILADSEERDFNPVAAMPRELYYFSGLSNVAPREWVVMFHVRPESRGYKLRLSHPDAVKAAFDVALVSLE